MIRMKALRQFRGRRDEGRNGMVKPGREFKVADERRAGDLERGGLAYRVYPTAIGTPAPEGQMETAPNPAALSGPLPSAGGSTGEEPLASSSPEDPAPQPPTSDPSEAEPDASPSTRAGGSRRGRRSYTRATEDGGDTDPASPTSED